MKKKLLLFLLILIVGLCPIIFVACGGVNGENISLSFSGNIEDNVLYLTVGDEENSSKDITVKIDNYTDAISRNLSFVSDSTSVSISSPTYYKDGSAKVKLTAVHGGTAYITVKTEQFSKEATIKVVVKEELKDFSLKNDFYEIYYEKNSGDLKINLEDYFDFSPKTATEKTLLAYDGSECLTENGITIISGIIADTSLTVVSPSVAEKSVSLLVKVVEKLESEQISLKKSTYLTNGDISFVDFKDGEVVTLLKNNNAEKNTSLKKLSTESCYIKVSIDSGSTNLEIKPIALTKQNGEWVENKHILAEEITGGEIASGLQTNEHIFKISYAGEDQMKIVFNFQSGGYVYEARKEILVNVLDAPSNISINGESLKTYNYIVYTTSNTYIGKKLKFNIFPEDSASYNAYLYFDEESREALVVRNSHGTLSGSKIQISNNDEIRISAIDNPAFGKIQTAILKVEFTYENIDFEFEVTLNFEIKKSPSAVKVITDANLNGENSDDYQNLSQVYLDINGSGKRIDASGKEIAYDGTNTVSFYVYGVVDGKLESGHTFTVKNNTNVVKFSTDDHGKVTIFASQVGTGSITISFETGEKISVKFQVINSVSEFGIVFPNSSQNSNIIKLENEDELKVALLTNKKIYVSKNILGDYQNLAASCQFGGEQIVSFKDGYFEVIKDTNEFVDASISFKYSFIDGETVQPQIVNYVFKILSLTKISKFNLTTNKSSTTFSLYDFSSVGFYSQNLATAVITLDIEPVSLRSTLISNIEWFVNGTKIDAEESDDENIDEYNYNELFTLRYNKTTGVATVLCDTKNFEGDIPEKIILQAQTIRNIAEMKVETLQKSVSFTIVKNIPIEKIETSIDEISIDKFNNKASVFTSVFPIDASNKNLDIQFIPNNLENKNAIKITKNSENFEVELQSGFNSGSGIIRIIAVDSYTDSTNFKTYVDIPLTICDGTEEYPYVISSSAGLRTLIDTEFKKYYKISGEIDLSQFEDWEYSAYALEGHIIGVNNAKIINIEVKELVLDTTKYYAGLFKEIGADASIEDISFVGMINIETTKDENGKQAILDECNIGLIAGENNGIIKNVFATLETSSVKSNGGYNVCLGGLFGKNHGKLSSGSNNANVVMIESLTFTDNSSSKSSHTLLIGGIAGYNDGTISKTDDNTISDLNNAQTTADVNIYVLSQYVNEVGNSDYIVSDVVNENEAIGGIFGYSTGNVENLTAIGEIRAGKLDDNNFVGYFNNVGGIVGYNSAEIKNCKSRVFVRGNQNIGGLVGSQVGGVLTLNKVQALEKGTGINSALIIGNQNVGGLVGYASSQSESITKNTVISYVSKNFNSLSVENAEYYGNILGISISTCNVGRIVAVDDSGAFSQNVAICDVNGNTLNVIDETFSEENAFFGYVKNSEAPVNYVSLNFVENLCDDPAYILKDTTLEEFISKVKAVKDAAEEGEETGVDFIILPPTQITITLAEDGKNNKLQSEEGSDLVFYLYYHQKLDANEQNKFEKENKYLISKYVNCVVNSNTPIILTSENENILKIDGNYFEVVGTGVVKIVVTSEFSKTLKEEFYIYAVNYVSNFDLFLSADKNSNQVLTNSQKVLDFNSSYMLYFNYLEKFNLKGYSSSSQIKVAILEDEKLLFAGNSSDLINFFGISYDAYQISFNNITNSKIIKFIPYFETKIDGNVYRTLFIDNLQLNEIELSGIQLTIKVEKQTKNISSNQTDVKIMPIYTAVFDIVVNTEKEDEILTINKLKLVDGVYLATEEIDCVKVPEGNNKNFKIYVSLKDKNITKEEKYKIEIISSNKKKCELNITFNPQTPNNVDVYFYNFESKTDSGENFSYVSTNKIVPGVAGLFEFLIVPNYSDYEYIEVSNLSTNAYNIIFENLYKREDFSEIQVITKTKNGFKISKETLEQLGLNGRFSIRAGLDARISDGEVVSFVVDIYDKNGEKIYNPIRYDFYAEHLPGVKISVDGVANTTETEKLKVAVGKTYSLDLNVKGFETGSNLQFNNSTKTYTDGEIVFKFNQIDNLLKLEKVDGKYRLVVTSETNFTDRNVTITAYGEKVTNNGIIRSAEFNFHIEVVYFIVKTNENNLDIILDFNDGIHHSAIGDEFTFEVSLNDEILIYDKSNAVIALEVENFLKSLSNYKNFSIKDATGYYSGWQSFENLESAQNRVRNKSMEFSTVDDKLVVKFKKLERPTNPSCIIKFEKYVYYNNGIPTISNGSNDDILISQTNLHFEVTEKTSLTNPYPIYNPEEFMNMVAGNYYILMEDITLPNNFTGISTLIGGFDGNNHNIILPSNLQVENVGENTTYNFAIFRTIAEGALFSNIRIKVNLTRVDLTAFNNINFGVLAVNNYGIITNCAVVGTNYNSRIEVLNKDASDSSISPESNISAFVVNNFGSITNSRVEISIKGKGNIAGFVYENNGNIASSFVYGTIVNETTSTSSITAGFVANNNYDATIFTSYITGDYKEEYLHQTNPAINTPFATADENSSSYKIVSSNYKLATFVYSNSGKISNCYSNIPVSSSAVIASGFVFSNESSGEISYSYSTSKMSNLTLGHTVFIGRTSDGLLNRGKIIECYAVEDVILDLGEIREGCYTDSNMIFMNHNLGSNENIEGLTIIKNKKVSTGGITISFDGAAGSYLTVQKQFASTNLFSKYALSTDASKTNAVWFFPASETQAEYRLTDGTSYTGYKKLVIGRPELVSPNLLVFGQQTFKQQIYNDATGETIYEYNTASNIGEISNPILIYNVDSLEAIADISGYNVGENRYYRLVCDVTYNSGTTSSKLYKYYFLGNLEGNSFTISNYVLDSSEILQSAGFFAGIGNSIKQKGSIKNVNFAPRYINLPNANSVGAVAGSVYGANIINVSVDGFENDYEGIVILGKNLVGGVVGFATGSYIFNNITSNISTNATYRASLDEKDVTINFNVYNANSVSFAGLIAGAVTGNGKIDYVYSVGNNVSIAECAGLVFGFAGENAVISNIYVNSSQNQIIKADIYGGVVVAVSNAKLNTIRVTDNNGRNSFFAQSVYSPKAVGNIVGFMIGGEINNAVVNTKTILPTSIQFVGGAVGIMETGKLVDVVITGDIRGGQHVGGLIGYAGEVETNGYSRDTDFKEIKNLITINNSYLVGSLTSNSSKSNVSIGTLVGLTTISQTPTGDIELGEEDSIIKISLTHPSEVKKYSIYFNNYSFESDVTISHGTIVAYYEKDQNKQTYPYDNENYVIENKSISSVVTPNEIANTPNN